MLIKVCLLIALASVALSRPCSSKLPKQPVLTDQQHWEKFKIDFKRVYETPEEEAKRFEIFKKNLHEVQEHNKKYEAGEVPYSKGINKFSDLTKEEFADTVLMPPRPNKPALLGSQ